jgi:hypothetical protein
MEEGNGGDGIQIGIAKPSNTENIVLLNNAEWFYPDYLDDGEFGPRFKP